MSIKKTVKMLAKTCVFKLKTHVFYTKSHTFFALNPYLWSLDFCHNSLFLVLINISVSLMSVIFYKAGYSEKQKFL